MKTLMGFVAVLGMIAVAAGPVCADGFASGRDISDAVDSYMSTTEQEANLVGGPGSAGYDDGFWISAGDFKLNINATLQARWESWNQDTETAGILNPYAGDTSGFSLPRATLKFSGTAPCDICWYMELEFGHYGEDVFEATNANGANTGFNVGDDSQSGVQQSGNFDNTREAWIEWCNCDAFNFRMGQIKLPTTRQLMVAPEHQQFIDVSLGSSWTAAHMPGLTDRNRDHGFMVHGSFGCSGEWSYQIAVTNGDGGDSIRNVLDHRTSDNLAFGARLNYAFLGPIGYVEGALANDSCSWAGEIGVWGHYYADRTDKPHATQADRLNAGVDLALLYGGFSFTGAYNIQEHTDLGGVSGADWSATSWLAQLGYHFPGTAWEIAGRASTYEWTNAASAVGDVFEFAFGVNYYLNGHNNKLQIDVAFLEGTDNAAGINSPYPGYQATLGTENSATMLRFQWQLAL
ncbi:MAG: hypothetical protein GY946_19005 [bacterium]|nr:hypothetical protein [bacterium]